MASKVQVRSAAWHIVIGSARGAAHHVSGLPNQDAADHRASSGSRGAAIVAIADGHGHARHFRSAAGSRLAVEVACQVTSELAAGLSRRQSEAEVSPKVRERLAEAIVCRWRAAVAEQLEAQPYSEQEQSALDRAADGPEIPYGSTVLVAMITTRWLVCAQVGDGDLLAIRPSGGCFHPIAADDRLDGHRTTSLCQPDAIAAFRTGAHDLRKEPLAAVFLATDGYGNAQSADAWHPAAAEDLAQLAAEHDDHWFEQQVPDWARRCASSEGSGDDTTIALLLPARRISMQPVVPGEQVATT